MILLTTEDRQKLEALDKLLKVLPSEYLNQLAEADQIVSKLKGGDFRQNGFILQLVEDNITMSTQVMQLQSDIFALRSQLHTIVKIMSRPLHDYQSTSDLNNLKSQLGVY